MVNPYVEELRKTPAASKSIPIISGLGIPPAAVYFPLAGGLRSFLGQCKQLAKQRAMQSEELLKLFVNSNRTYDEVAAFLKEGMTEEQLAKNFTKRKGRKPRKRAKEF